MYIKQKNNNFQGGGFKQRPINFNPQTLVVPKVLKKKKKVGCIMFMKKSNYLF